MNIRGLVGALVLAVGLTLALPSSRAGAQAITTDFFSLDVVQDASVASSGESFIAKTGEPEAAMLNPATLASVNRYSLRYTHKSFRFPEYNMGFGGARVTVPLTIGTFSFAYRRFQYEVDLLVSEAQHPDGYPAHEEVANWTYAFSYGRIIAPWLSIGATVSLFNSAQTFDLPGIQSTGVYADKKPILADLGLVVHAGGMTPAGSMISDQFSIGTSIQNLGTDYTLRPDPPNQFITNDSGASVPLAFDTSPIPMARFFRIGFEYTVAAHSRDPDGLLPASFTVTGGYYNILNAPDYQNYIRERYSLGAEMSFFEILSFQGGILRPGEYFPGGFSKPIRWSAEVRVPCRRLSANLPFGISFRYGEITATGGFTAVVPEKLISVGLEYDPAFR